MKIHERIIASLFIGILTLIVLADFACPYISAAWWLAGIFICFFIKIKLSVTFPVIFALYCILTVIISSVILYFMINRPSKQHKNWVYC